MLNEIISYPKDYFKVPTIYRLRLKNAEKLEIQELETFINGIRNDQDAVENAIRYSYSNGLAERSVNKLKSIKRIMYGRCQFNLLRSKVLLLESLKNKNINDNSHMKPVI